MFSVSLSRVQPGNLLGVLTLLWCHIKKLLTVGSQSFRARKNGDPDSGVFYIVVLWIREIFTVQKYYMLSSSSSNCYAEVSETHGTDV